MMIKPFKNTGKVCCFGEVLLRVSPARDWMHNNDMKVYIGGAEGNVATALGNWGVPVRYCTALPDNYIGRDIESSLIERHIDTCAVLWTGDRVGLYYMQQGADLKHSGVIYDRFHSSFYCLKPGTIDWEAILEDVSWFHFSAISPALSADAAAVCLEAVEAASRKGITLSVDLNYRAKLWKYGKTPAEVMPRLVAYCDVIMGNIWAAHVMLGARLDADVERIGTRDNYLRHAADTSEEILHRFPNCKIVAHSFRFDEANEGIRYYGALYTGNMLSVSPEFRAGKIADKAGSGDCFMAGLIRQLRDNRSPEETIRFAAAAAFGKLHEIGDASMQTVDDIQKRLADYE